MNERTNESMKEKQFPETAADGCLQTALLSHESLIYKQLILTPKQQQSLQTMRRQRTGLQAKLSCKRFTTAR
jgi:hypothetical protein